MRSILYTVQLAGYQAARIHMNAEKQDRVERLRQERALRQDCWLHSSLHGDASKNRNEYDTETRRAKSALLRGRTTQPTVGFTCILLKLTVE